MVSPPRMVGSEYPYSKIPGRTMVFHVSGLALTAAELLMCTSGGRNPRASDRKRFLEELDLAQSVLCIQHLR